MNLGLQLYGCMELFRENPEQFLREISGMGYTQIEPCIALGITAGELAASGMKPVWLPEEVSVFSPLLKKYALDLTSCHFFGDPLKHLDTVLSLVRSQGIRQIILNLPQADPEGEPDILTAFSGFALRCQKLASELKEAGAELWLHNGAPELRQKTDGVSLLEFVLRRCGGSVGLQLDVGWALYAGDEPAALMRHLAPYLKSVHYKDLKAGYETLPADQIHTALGSGCLDTGLVYQTACSLNLTQLIDQDQSDGSFLQDLKQSSQVLHSLSQIE